MPIQSNITGGAITYETDPAYQQDKPNIALKSEVQALKRTITDITKVSGYISTLKLNGVLKTVQRDVNGIATGLV